MFDGHLAKMDSLVLAHLGSTVYFIHGEQSWERKSVPEHGESSLRFARGARRVAGSTQTLEISSAELPAVPWEELKVQIGSAVYQVVDRDVDGTWVRFYLSPAAASPIGQSDSNAFLF